MIRRFLSYMPQNVWELPPRGCLRRSGRPRARRNCCRIVPRERRKPYNMRKLIEMVVDEDSLFEIQPSFGKAVITALGAPGRPGRRHHRQQPDGVRRRRGRARPRASRRTSSSCATASTFRSCSWSTCPASWSGSRPRRRRRCARACARLRGAAGDRADVHGRDPQVLRHGRNGRDATRTDSTSRSRGRRPSGDRCRSRAASLPRSAARSSRRPIRSAREEEIEAELRGVASPFRTAEAFASRTSSIRARPGHICAGFSMPPRPTRDQPRAKAEIRRASISAKTYGRKS